MENMTVYNGLSRHKTFLLKKLTGAQIKAELNKKLNVEPSKETMCWKVKLI